MICKCFKFEDNRMKIGEIMTFLPWKIGHILALHWCRVNLLIKYWAKLHILFQYCCSSVFPFIFTGLADAKTSLFYNMNTVLNFKIWLSQNACCVMKLEINH